MLPHNSALSLRLPKKGTTNATTTTTSNNNDKELVYYNYSFRLHAHVFHRNSETLAVSNREQA